MKIKVTRYLEEENVEKLRLGAFKSKKSQSKLLDELLGEWKIVDIKMRNLK